MTPARRRPSPSSDEVAELRARLAEAEETLRAIRSGDVDALVVAGKEGTRVFTLEGADHEYRLLIEAMNEGALTLTAGAVILYANRCFAEMVACPMERLTGSSLLGFLSAEDRATLRSSLQRPAGPGARFPVQLRATDGTEKAVQVAVGRLGPSRGGRGTVGMVVTDLTEVRRTKDLLRSLTRRLVAAQESERASVARDVHDSITQRLCAVLFRTQALVNKLAAGAEPAPGEAKGLREMLGRAAEEAERISRGLRCDVLENLGLVAAVRAAGTEFTGRTGVPVDLDVARMKGWVPAAIELTIYRSFEEALRNVEHHACAAHVRVRLVHRGGFVRLTVEDDGKGVDPATRPGRRRSRPALGLLGVRERVTGAGGTLSVRFVRGVGTTFDVRIPVAVTGGPGLGLPAATA